MNFDIISMKQRARGLMSSTKPNPKILGAIFSILLFAYTMIFYYVCETANLFILLIAELVYLNFRNCLNWYAIKITRNEATSISDAFCAYKHNAVKVIFLSIIKDILYVVGFMLFVVGVVFPVYWFRFSTYILKDENINVFKALIKSMKLMKGHYIELIKLDLSNLGWYILMLLTNGVAGFYVKPYTAITYAEFYDYLKAQSMM